MIYRVQDRCNLVSLNLSGLLLQRCPAISWCAFMNSLCWVLFVHSSAKSKLSGIARLLCRCSFLWLLFSFFHLLCLMQPNIGWQISSSTFPWAGILCCFTVAAVAPLRLFSVSFCLFLSFCLSLAFLHDSACPDLLGANAVIGEVVVKQDRRLNFGEYFLVG